MQPTPKRLPLVPTALLCSPIKPLSNQGAVVSTSPINPFEIPPTFTTPLPI